VSFREGRTCDDKNEEDAEAAENTAQNDSSRWTHASQLAHVLINTRVTKIGEPPWALFLFALWVHGALPMSTPCQDKNNQTPAKRTSTCSSANCSPEGMTLGFSAKATQSSGCRRAGLPQKHLCQVCRGT
jgi:hypothetical protein